MSGGIVVTDQAFGGVERERALAERHGVPFAEFSCRTEDETVEAVAGARVALVNFAPMTRRVLAALADGATVIRYGIGFDNVDVAAATELGVAVCNVPDYGADTVADHTVASLLGLLRRLKGYDRAVRERGWLGAGELGPLRGFAETTVGLVGTGRIGRSVAARLRPFGFRIVASDPFVSAEQLAPLGIELVSFDELLRISHAVSLHAPLTPENEHLIDAAALAAMPEGAVLVNTSRGGLVDTLALADALRSGHLAGAALDVVEPEPLPDGSPLREIDAVVLTPHAAFFSDTSLAALQRLATEEAERALLGQPLRCRVA
ncbi:D-3-phosphoglycerate dehydrogenase [Diaminobutyricimonas aerilata]|uniref:D-3-phosphoglycerate dehydrogenase n=1 Tax=Diaminobutyricimonas aerilata TaxID=1162967 RepID=A0A2M9CMD3_9MICO|nr:C-terminal binding protein [Diaminobutyricimonas aerilata]PJJ73034.1 D-3-phosphoglycerate dehydrogenase [Diaminobutyricimonas aerilata]